MMMPAATPMAAEYHGEREARAEAGGFQHRRVCTGEAEVGQQSAKHDRRTCGDPGGHIQLLCGFSESFFLHQQRGDADDAGEDAHAGERNREQHHTAQQRFVGKGKAVAEDLDGEDDGGHNRADVAFQQVGTETGDVADVIADVIRDRGGVAGVVLGDMRFGFADQVGAPYPPLWCKCRRRRG